MFSSFKKLVPEPVKNVFHLFQALLGSMMFLFPGKRLKIIGVTGTDGKTTVVHLLHHILEISGYKVSMISTVEARVGQKIIDTGLHVTTPDPLKVQSLLKKMLDVGSEYVILETTSHGLAQNRAALLPFHIGIITNVTHEHLDYHKSAENYLSSKSKILAGVKFRILNIDDTSFEKLKDTGSGRLLSFGTNKNADFLAKDIRMQKEGLEFELYYPVGRKKIDKIKIVSPLTGDFNVYNILAAFAAGVSLKLEPAKIASAISNFKGVAGRMEHIDKGQDFDVIIDFAHTPAALEATLKTLNKFKSGKIIVVFGSAGERDVEKRPMMGKIATQLADYSLFTTEDPRNEDVNEIIEQISKGALSAGGIPNRTFWKIPDRAEAINTAIQTLAKEGDTVAILGKGHEKSMNILGKEYPWSDEQLVHNALALRLRQ